MFRHPNDRKRWTLKPNLFILQISSRFLPVARFAPSSWHRPYSPATGESPASLDPNKKLPPTRIGRTTTTTTRGTTTIPWVGRYRGKGGEARQGEGERRAPLASPQDGVDLPYLSKPLSYVTLLRSFGVRKGGWDWMGIEEKKRTTRWKSTETNPIASAKRWTLDTGESMEGSR